MNFPNNYIVFDTETTGFDPVKDRITEMAAIRVVEGRTVATFSALLNWGVAIPEKITQITGIDNALIDREGLDPKLVLRLFNEFVGGELRIMGHNVIRFDIPFIKGNFPGWQPKYEPLVLDTAALYKATKLGRQLPDESMIYRFMVGILEERHAIKYSVDTACAELGIDKSGVSQHRALGDCVLTNEIYRKMCLKKEGMLI